MKLLRHTPCKANAQETQYAIAEALLSDDIEKLKAKAVELCRQENLAMGVWTSRYPIMGGAAPMGDLEWVMKLDNGTYFSIEK